ncbi:MAG: hypothetical protein A2140_00715 [Candidatus Muproteobacteria bacterium RBG_16_62_13]|uniref:UPF0276 protein A2140_00715 n=1 Tax=Candidatus Muproteobacteria bacterium RBG_16_62_13 TaxID=1817756 RepID=A0A1F6T562_9PROT|nr:MAG: hypothetical protein A2140_00715 [Candidatus Muproteobacteria bacterium RBG_16_62_13]
MHRDVQVSREAGCRERSRAGIGLRAEHYRDVLDTHPAIGWLEVHSENYFELDSIPFHYLERARREYPVSLHGVGLSLGSTDPLNFDHLRQLKALIERIEPGLVSDHLCWCSVSGRYLNDLLPLPYTEEALIHTASRVREAQDFLGRRLLIENPSSYLEYRHSTIPEWEFLAALVKLADCDILLDINNVYVSSRNHGFGDGTEPRAAVHGRTDCGFDPRLYLAAIPGERVREIHLAGHSVREFPEGAFLIDTHNAPVCEDVWTLYRETIERLGARPTLIEWDSELPALSVLVDEAGRADRIMKENARDSRAA